MESEREREMERGIDLHVYRDGDWHGDADRWRGIERKMYVDRDSTER